jgi:DNA polymerase I-like protein with 3'-5' exonuclease and polymerase domains
LLRDKSYKYGFKIILFAHDEWQLEVQKEKANTTAEILKRECLRASKKYLNYLEVPAEAKISESWEK